MNNLENVRRIIYEATGGDGFLEFGGSDAHWHPINDFRECPDEAGLYAIGLPLGVQYHRFVSKIVYFGSTIGSIRNRIRSHATDPHNDRIQRLSERFSRALQCSFYVLKGIDQYWVRELEDAAMQEALRRFGCYPICNCDPILAKYRDECRGLIRIKPCVGLPFPQDFLSLQCGDGTLNDRPVPEGGWSTSKSLQRGIEIVFVASTISASDADPNTESIQSAGDADVGISSTTPPYVSPTIWACNVALWSSEKMARIISVCQQLKRAKASGKSQVISFDAPSESVPTPDTWGEVALIKAREFAGTFHPESRVWVKVRNGKSLLGQAMLYPDYYQGEDKSDLPQTSDRDSIESKAGWESFVHSIPAELPDDFHFTAATILEIPTSVTTDSITQNHLNLLRAAHEFDTAHAAKLKADETKYALDRIRRLKAIRILDERIESLYQSIIAGDSFSGRDRMTSRTLGDFMSSLGE